MKLKQLIEGVDIINISGDTTGDVSTLCYAANKCEKMSLFVAIPGLAHDGHDFIEEAISKGAGFIVYEKDFEIPDQVTAIKVADSRRALGVLAKNYFEDPSAKLKLIGVTGTNGKTTITYLLESILTKAGFKCGVLGTVNYRYNNKIIPAPNTTPESYEMQKILREMADNDINHVIAEVSSHALDLRRVDDCDFDLGIFTNLSPEHLDYHVTMDSYFQAKKRFFTEVLPKSKKHYQRKAVVNADDSWGIKLLGEIWLSALTYGIERNSDVRVLEYVSSLDGITATISVENRKMKINSKLIGRFNLSNIAAATAAAQILNINISTITAGIESLVCVPGRLEKVDSDEGIHVFVDYAHKADALKQVLQNLLLLKKKKIITVFGCGGNRDRGKRPMMGETATSYSELTIVTSDNPRLEEPLAIIAEIEAGIDQNKIKKVASDNPELKEDIHCYKVISDRRKAIEMAVRMAQPGDIVLIAGKGHEDYQILGTKKIPFDDRLVAAQALKFRS